jgi:DNA processing protein
MTDRTEETLALLALDRACRVARGVTPGQLSATVERVGSAQTVLAGDFSPLCRPEARVRTAARDAAGTQAPLAEALTAWTASGLQLTTVLDDRYPPTLRALADHPPLLWHRGPLLARDDRALAVIGTRAESPEGRRRAREFATALAEARITVVSGLAVGIDTEAHIAALAAGGRTLAVLGHGLARSIYPGENAPLAAAIAEHGALVSAFWPDTPPRPATFRARNAVTSGLSRATLVVESGPRSGARLQARLAHEQGRPVYLLASLIEREPWARAFVAHGRAEPVYDPADLLARWRSLPGVGEGASDARPTVVDAAAQLRFDVDPYPPSGGTPRSYTECNGRRI